jgi:diaminohydroxyphosphoribosylaminopyrimidine deaminase/5-amino-6-(5-phosphoribosylamino)uracil reductase
VDDTEAMQQALACARMVEGRTSPRPPVGAALVRDGTVIARGATAPPYGPHAEIQALAEAGAAAYGADLYTTLEPCCVTIHTPPCTDAIIRAGVRRVVVGALDPNPLVAGRGIEQLQAAGIIVEPHPTRAAEELIRPFATFMTQGRPFVTAKWAMTLDGKLATRTGDARWISGPQARLWVHDLRDRVDAILVGAGTACIDDPQLTVRLPAEQSPQERTPRQQPLRVVLATHGQLPGHLHLLQPELAARTCIVVGETCSQEQRRFLQAHGVEAMPVAVDTQGRINLCAALQELARRGCMHILMEGGAALLGSAFDRSCIDRVAVIIAPKLVGGTDAPSPIGGRGLAAMHLAWHLQNMQIQKIGDDMLMEGDMDYDSNDTRRETIEQESR